MNLPSTVMFNYPTIEGIAGFGAPSGMEVMHCTS